MHLCRNGSLNTPLNINCDFFILMFQNAELCRLLGSLNWYTVVGIAQSFS